MAIADKSTRNSMSCKKQLKFLLPDLRQEKCQPGRQAESCGQTGSCNLQLSTCNLHPRTEKRKRKSKKIYIYKDGN